MNLATKNHEALAANGERVLVPGYLKIERRGIISRKPSTDTIRSTHDILETIVCTLEVHLCKRGVACGGHADRAQQAQEREQRGEFASGAHFGRLNNEEWVVSSSTVRYHRLPRRYALPKPLYTNRTQIQWREHFRTLQSGPENRNKFGGGVTAKPCRGAFKRHLSDR